jgi:hypothetical protein
VLAVLLVSMLPELQCSTSDGCSGSSSSGSNPGASSGHRAAGCRQTPRASGAASTTAADDGAAPRQQRTHTSSPPPIQPELLQLFVWRGRLNRLAASCLVSVGAANTRTEVHYAGTAGF